MSELLLDWFKQYHLKEGNKVCSKEFRKKALSLSKCQDFKASKGWLQKFKKRYQINFK